MECRFVVEAVLFGEVWYIRASFGGKKKYFSGVVVLGSLCFAWWPR